MQVLSFSVLTGCFVATFPTLLPQLATKVYLIDATGLAYLYAVAGAGAALGAFTTTSLMARFPWEALLLASMIGGAISIAGLGLAGEPYLAACFIAAASYAGIVPWVVATATLQRITPDLFRGRILGLNFLAFYLAVGVGSLGLGAIASWLGPRTALFAAGLGLTVVLGLRAWRITVVARRRA